MFFLPFKFWISAIVFFWFVYFLLGLWFFIFLSFSACLLGSGFFDVFVSLCQRFERSLIWKISALFSLILGPELDEYFFLSLHFRLMIQKTFSFYCQFVSFLWFFVFCFYYLTTLFEASLLLFLFFFFLLSWFNKSI